MQMITEWNPLIYYEHIFAEKSSIKCEITPFNVGNKSSEKKAT